MQFSNEQIACVRNLMESPQASLCLLLATNHIAYLPNRRAFRNNTKGDYNG